VCYGWFSEVTLECEALPAVSSSEEAIMRSVIINMEPVDGGHHLEQQLDNVIMEKRNHHTSSTYSIDSRLARMVTARYRQDGNFF